MANSKDVLERKTAVEQLLDNFASFSDKNTAWSNLHQLTQDEDEDVRWNAVDVLGFVFSHIPDKDAAWSDLHQLTQDEDEDVRWNAVNALGSAFSHIPDKDTAWSDLHQLTQDEDEDVRWNAVNALGSAFSHIPDKDTAWSDLHRLTQDEDEDVRWNAVNALGSAFSHIPDKDTAWSDLHRLTQDESKNVRRRAINALGSAFSHIPDKNAAWSDLHRLTQDESRNVRRNATRVLGSVFLQISDKDAAWSDLHWLTRDEDKDVRRNVADALGSAFSHIPDKNTAYSDLIRLTQDENEYVRWNAVDAFGYAFSHIPDKDATWFDLHRLTQDENGVVRRNAARALGSAFSHIPDKNAVWSDLHQLTQDEDSVVRRNAARALGSAFSHIPDKDAACSDLHQLIQDENSIVRGGGASALGSAFSHIHDKDAVWSDLHQLTQDGDKYVRMYAYHSLGSASVYKAIEKGEDNFKEELEKAINYFEKSSREAEYEFLNPANFCLPFYRSYYAIISDKQEAETEAAKYLDEAKKATGRSESREVLLKAVENLANALREAQKPLDFGETKEHLMACRQYCDHTAELADSARGKSPVAAAAIERGIPIVGGRVKEIIAEIQEKAEALCKQTKDTPLEDLGKEVNAKGKELLLTKEQPKIVGQKMSSFIISLSALCAKFSPENAEDTCQLLKKANETENLDDTIELLDEAMGKMLSQSDKERIPQTPVHESKPINQAIQPNSQQYITNKNHINIVHLSDIHLGTEGEALKYLTQLEADLVNNLEVKNIKYLVISGDVANFSREYEYSAAVGLINGLIERFEIDKSRIIIVPGNHDLNWDFSRKAYNFVYKGGEEFPDPLPDGKYIPGGDEGVLLQDEDLYQKRFVNFNLHLYEKVLGTQYPLDYAEQGILHQCPEDQILFLALNSCWEIDHHKPHHERASININSLSSALGKLMDGEYKDWLKIAVWHHPVTGPEMMKNVEFLEQLAVHKFQICMHGHIHEASEDFYKYDDKRGMHIVGAGTFGAPKREQTKSIPLQYNLLTLDQENKKITINTRKKEKPDGAWSADPRWVDKDNPQPWYEIELK